MIEVILFVVILLLSFSNGFLIVNYFEQNLRASFIPVFLVVGIIVTTLLAYFIRLLGLPFWSVTLISVVFWFFNYKKLLQFPKFNPKRFLPVIIFTFFVTLIIGAIGFFQGYHNGNLVFFNENAHDGLWHIALQRALINNVPPQNPIYSGQILKGYHYFADLFWAYTDSVGGLSVEVIYLLLLPIFLPALFALSTVGLFSTLVKDKILIYFMSLILVLGSGWAFFVPFFFNGGSSNQSTFWLDQPVGYIVNPHLLLSFSIVNIILMLYFLDSKKWQILIGILLGSLVAIKVYAFLVYGPIFGLVALFSLRKKDFSAFISSMVAVVLAVVLVITSGVSNGFPFFLEPGWFIKTMFEASDHLNAPWWEIQRQVFAEHKNILHLIVHWIYGFIIFFFGNFGLKALALFLIPILLVIKSQRFERSKIVLCSGLIFISLVLPLLVLQKGVVWSSIQFLHFAQLPLCLLLLFMITRLKKGFSYLILGIIFLAGLPTTLLAFSKTLDQTNYISYSGDLISGLKEVKKLPFDSEIIVDGDFQSTSLVPAMSGKAVYYTDPNMLGVLQLDGSGRKNYLTQTVDKFICPQNKILILNPESTISGKFIFQNGKVKIIKCL